MRLLELAALTEDRLLAQTLADVVGVSTISRDGGLLWTCWRTTGAAGAGQLRAHCEQGVRDALGKKQFTGRPGTSSQVKAVTGVSESVTDTSLRDR
ncbi:hypothetical protein JOF56_007936 [Kibdelosporangium banguiense]|uniref:Uncharacterized protein n=1 Tax=Kibdelosporangium banguiense TaxID=1365924 RepID=A0ABS4TUC9_9PSEU|nr:hypothetical protein [Kibdelosporangium banguiense]MBP2327551.1 hypothetical protein [Kibdelosporangium banguiense]